MFALASKFCCFPLESGIKFWGWLGTVISAIGVVVSIVLLTTTEEAENRSKDGVFDPYYEAGIIDRETGYIIMIVICAMGAFTSYFVVMSIQKRNKNFLVPWMISNALSLLVWTVLLLPVLFPAFLIMAPVGLIYYVWYCMYSMYQVLKLEEQGGANAEVPYYNN